MVVTLTGKLPVRNPQRELQTNGVSADVFGSDGEARSLQLKYHVADTPFKASCK